MTDQPSPAGSAPEPAAAQSEEGAGERGPAQARGIKEAARDITASTSNPGGINVSNALRRQAEQSLSAGRDFVGGNQFNVNLGGAVGSGTRTVMYQLSEETLTEIRGAFVAPPGYKQLVTAVRGRPVVLLRSRDGQGKWATAARLLLASGVAQIRQLPAGSDLTSLTGDQFEAGVGYLLPDMPGSGSRALRADTLRGLENALATAGARMIITIAADMPITDTRISTYVVDLGRAVDATAVVEAHLRWRCGDPDASRILGDPTVTAMLAHLINADTSCARASELARMIWENSRNGTADVARITERANRRASDDFDAWFDGLGDLPLQCLAVALAVLNGLPQQTVSEAAESLRVRLDPPPTMVPGMPLPANWELAGRPAPFGATRNQRLLKIRARLLPISLPTRYGLTPTEVVRYDDPAYPQMVLDRVWQEYDDIRPQLVDWLRELGGHSMETVRVWTATAVGSLATRNFDYVVDRIIMSWARSSVEERRDNAAFALRKPAIDGALYTQVLSVVRRWSQPDGDEHLRTTAARAYGSSIGHAAPAQAIAALEELARCDDADTAIAIGRSMAELVEWDPGLAVQVVAAVRRWSVDRAIDRRNASQLVFLVIATELVTNVPNARPDGDSSTRWPGLLHFAAADPTMHEIVAGLWRDALRGGLFWQEARGVWTGWAQLAEADPHACHALGRLSRAIGTDPRTGTPHNRIDKILLRLADVWCGAGNPLPSPRAAAAVRAAL